MNFECIKKLYPLEPGLQHSRQHQYVQGLLAALLSMFIDVLEKLIGIILLIAHGAVIEQLS